MKIAAKVLAVATAVALGAFALAGCSSSNSKEDDKLTKEEIEAARQLGED